MKKIALLATAFLLLLAPLLRASEIKGEKRDIVYGQGAGRDLHLDFYPGSRPKAPLLVFVHGGGWCSGNQHSVGLGGQELHDAGFAIASVEYRLAPDSIWPAQLQDVKCAVRYLRSHADSLSLDPNRFGAWGTSAGGHLVSLLALVGPEAGYEGDGGSPGVSSGVQAVADLFGPTDFLAPDVTTGKGAYFLKGFLGGNMELRQAASPVTYVHPKSPPFLIMHGEDDELVPFHQARLLQEHLLAAHSPVTLVPVQHAGHDFRGNPEPDKPALAAQLVDFFQHQLNDVRR